MIHPRIMSTPSCGLPSPSYSSVSDFFCIQLMTRMGIPVPLSRSFVSVFGRQYLNRYYVRIQKAVLPNPTAFCYVWGRCLSAEDIQVVDLEEVGQLAPLDRLARFYGNIDSPLDANRWSCATCCGKSILSNWFLCFKCPIQKVPENAGADT
jgi:hypothetical protein